MTRKISGLDRFIIGMNAHYGEKSLQICPGCGMRRWIPMYFEYGGWFVIPSFEDLDFCTVCQLNMEWTGVSRSSYYFPNLRCLNCNRTGIEHLNVQDCTNYEMI